MSKKMTTSERLEEIRIARKEAKVEREKVRNQRAAAKVKTTEAKAQVRKQQGGTGIKLVLFRRGKGRGKKR